MTGIHDMDNGDIQIYLEQKHMDIKWISTFWTHGVIIYGHQTHRECNKTHEMV